MPRERLLGYLFVVVSASAFAVMPAFAVFSYRGGLSVSTVLFYRFAIAAVVFVPVALWQLRRSGERPSLRAVVIALLMGSVLYVGQSTCYFTAVERSTPALGALLLYLYPGLVAIGASIIDRRRPSVALVGALALSFVGIVLSLGPLEGGVNAQALAYGVGAALFYTTYILVGNHNGAALSSMTMSALVFVSATTTYATTGLAAGTLALPQDARTWACVLALGLFCTVVAIWFFFLGMERVGPTMASLGSTIEPVGAVVVGALVVGTQMTGMQVLGAVLVIAGAVAGMLLTPAADGTDPDADAVIPVHEPAH